MNVDSVRLTTPQFPQVSGGQTKHEVQGKPVQSEPKAAQSEMSQYLSSDEKDLLGVLFPPSGRDFGIGQYRKVQAPAQTGRSLGQKIDITT
jgi:hypothetical protein